MFIAALFITAKIWKQPKCPSKDDWIKTWYTHTHTHTHRGAHTCTHTHKHMHTHTHTYSRILLILKKNDILPFVTI